MYALILVLHIIVSLLLVVIILIQGGRGGMAEAFGGSGAQSLFGGGANIVMTKVTAVGAGIFLVTCLTLAKLSAERGRSIVERLPAADLLEGSAGLPDLVPDASIPGVIPAVAEPTPADAAPADAAPAETPAAP